MKHYGDITKLSGYELPVVDVITGGSPCQDLSVAGKRAGLAGERSGLFMEQMRIVKEMREHDRLSGRTGFLVRPRYMVWENVPGAFSSGSPKGADFAAVIEEIIKVAEPGAAVCVRVPDGGWTKSGCYYADDGSWSIAWRVHDAQFWGVPQRRKRISLVADFGGLSASEILFERQGVSGNSEPGETEGQGVTAGSESGAGGAISFQERAGKPGGGKGILIQVEHVGALSTLNNQSVFAYGIDHVITTGGNCTAQGPCVYEEVEGTLKAAGPHSVFAYGAVDCIGVDLYNQAITGEVAASVTAAAGGTNHSGPKVLCLQGNMVDREVQQGGTGVRENIAYTLDAVDRHAVLVFDKEMYNSGEKMTGEMQARYDNVAPTVRADSHPSGICTSVVRRLTPMECERLQGYPDGWTDIGDWTDSKGKKRKAADGPRYKALGNSIALPFWQFLARRICAQYERDVTLGSLFDGIGGFPYVFERCGAKAVWASEIEEFAIAVTKKRFPEEDEG